MIISKQTKLYQIAELLGSEVSEEEARSMLELLIEKYGYGINTENISESDWFYLSKKI